MGTLRLSVADVEPMPRYSADYKALHRAHWRAPTYIGFQAPVPKPPDYSTRAAVTTCCLEFVGHKTGNSSDTYGKTWDTQWLRPAMRDKSFAKLYKAFQESLR